ncbi:UNVERIFIED_ORG: hypothetical protein J2W82_002551 [Pseudomonas mohnii]|nr:hypothetical protein [Pseudomonas mohnii]
MKNQFLVGIRTNTFNSRSIYIASYYQSQGIDVVFVTDETKAEVNTGFFEKISFNQKRLDELGLFREHSKIGWLCGDYFYYMLALDRPAYSGYWLIEDDAIVSAADLKELLSKPIVHNIDFIAHHLSPANGTFLRWVSSMQNAVGSKDPLLKCLFCITYMSKKLVLDCLKYRQIMSKKYITKEIDKHIHPFPNDESHVANVPSREQYSFLSMKDAYPNMCENFLYTSQGRIFEIDPTKSAIKQGFYHPIRILGNDLDELESRLDIKYRQNSKNFQEDVLRTTLLLREKAKEIEQKYI